MNHAKNSDITPDSGRSEIKIKKGLLWGNLKFSEESALSMLDLIQQRRSCMKISPVMGFDQSPNMGFELSDEVGNFIISAST